MFENAFKNIDDILHKDAGCGSELDYVEQTSWILFLKDLYANVTRNHTCTSIEELMDRVSTYIEARNLKLETIPA